MAGMARVIESYLALFDEALAQGEFDRAAAYLETIRDLNPDSPLLADGERRLGGGPATAGRDGTATAGRDGTAA